MIGHLLPVGPQAIPGLSFSETMFQVSPRLALYIVKNEFELLLLPFSSESWDYRPYPVTTVLKFKPRAMGMLGNLCHKSPSPGLLG